MKYGIQFGIFTVLFGIGFIGLNNYIVGITALFSGAVIFFATIKNRNKSE